MKKKLVILWIGFLVSGVFCFSDSVHQTLFEEAQTAYQKGDFKASLRKFLKLNQSDFVSAEVYYNIANSYYKLGHLGKAILFYERAHDLQKRDDDIRANLSIAKKQVKDRWKENPESFLRTILSPILENLNLWELTFLNVILLWMLLILASLKLMGKKNEIMKFLPVFLIPLFLICAVSLFSSWQEKHSSRAKLTQKTVLARSGPGKSFPVTLKVHEGTTLKIAEQNGDWSKAIFPDHTIGWLKSKTYELI
jgi:tetratricopeptide (TPR) repeat protein